MSNRVVLAGVIITILVLVGLSVLLMRNRNAEELGGAESLATSTVEKSEDTAVDESGDSAEEIDLSETSESSNAELSDELASEEQGDTATEEAGGEPISDSNTEPSQGTDVDEQDNLDGQLEVVMSYDRSKNELPEGVAVDKQGDVYVSLGPPIFIQNIYGAIIKLDTDGTSTLLVEYPSGPAPLGITVDSAGTLYYALPSDQDSERGVYRLSSSGTPERLEGSEAIVFPNALALGEGDSLFVTDSILGAVWRFALDSAEEPESWVIDPLLDGCGDFGANGIAVWENQVYVANTAKGLLVSVPINSDGSAGEPAIVAGIDDCEAGFDDLDSMDGIALDVDGNIYALIALQNKLVRIDPQNGSTTLLLSANSGLDIGASLAFGTTDSDQQSVYITNFALPVGFSPSNSLGPALLKVDVGATGLPLP